MKNRQELINLIFILNNLMKFGNLKEDIELKQKIIDDKNENLIKIEKNFKTIKKNFEINYELVIYYNILNLLLLE